MSGLPKTVEIPPISVIPPTETYIRLCWEHLRSSLAALPQIEHRVDDTLKAASWCCLEMRVDGKVVLYDYSDYLQPEIPIGPWQRQFRFHYTTALSPFARFGSFPPQSFPDWSLYDAIQAVDWQPGVTILHRQAILPGLETSDNLRDRGLSRRRGTVRKLLLSDASITNLLQVENLPQEKFFADAFSCRASVHIPGSWDHSLDRGQQQLFGLGICTISPDIWTACGDERPEPGIHYVGLRDDLQDVLDKVHWCLDNRDEVKRIGDNAKAFFRRHCTPIEIWRHVYARIG